MIKATRRTRTRPAKKTVASARSRRSARRTGSRRRTSSHAERAVAASLHRHISTLRLRSVAGARRELRRLHLGPAELAASIHRVFRTSESKAQILARGIVAEWGRRGVQEKRIVEEAASLIRWARREGRRPSRMICRALQRAKRDIHVVHNIGGMRRKDARTFMREYFAEGGTLRVVADWLRRAGEELRTKKRSRRKKRGLFGRIGGWLKKAVRTVGDALGAAGKSLIGALGSVVKWTSKKIADFVEGVVRAGYSIGQVLAAAAKRGASTLKKLIRAAVDAGRRVGEILAWATSKIASAARRRLDTIRMVLDGLLRAGVSLAAAITAIVRDVAARFRKGLFEGLVALGYAPIRIMKEALRAAGGVAALAFATLLDLLGGHRGLTAAERRQARRLFGSSIDLDRVKIAVASIPSDLIHLVNGGRPFTTMYVINFSSRSRIVMKTLMHEMVHVWQGVVAGPVYMVDALEAQLKLGRRAYSVTNRLLREGKNRLSSFNREQQAVIGEEYWWERWGKREFPRSGGRDLDVRLLRPYALQFARTRLVQPRKLTRLAPGSRSAA